jgi:hypothetical protein
MTFDTLSAAMAGVESAHAPVEGVFLFYALPGPE